MIPKRYHNLKQLSLSEDVSAKMSIFWDWTVTLSVLSGLILLIYWSVSGNLFRQFLGIQHQARWTNLILRPSILWAAIGYVLLMFRTLLWMRYKPFPAADFPEAPSITVIIPAYIEGAMVEKTILSVAEADYPHDRIEIIVVDDGSRDDTWSYIQKARRYPRLVMAL